MLRVMNLQSHNLERLIDWYKPFGVKEEFIRRMFYSISEETGSEESVLISIDCELSERFNCPAFFSDREAADMFGVSIFHFRLAIAKTWILVKIKELKRKMVE